jgi:hypothetical protein
MGAEITERNGTVRCDGAQVREFLVRFDVGDEHRLQCPNGRARTRFRNRGTGGHAS